MKFPAFNPESHVLGALVNTAREQPGGKLDLRDESGAIVATVQAHELPKRPKDMPRHLRPKEKLSKRQRDAAKRKKLGIAA
jgi:hypothetical protein